MEQTKITVQLPDELTEQIYQQFLNIANEAVRQATENIGFAGKSFLNEKELKKYLGIGQDTLNELLEQNLLSYSKIGRQKLYFLSDVENCINQLKI
ncbi:hypothetical protein HZY88_02635 [Aerococcaceae bacterium DSM 111176]|nr:hypothetical protein [Aerococcaceae bacterium DSM 111176]